jgi:inosine/xanthosine triphosphatase
MKKVIVASENPVKVAVAKKVFSMVFPHEECTFIAVSSKSGVPDQPLNDETRQGAYNRLDFVRTHHPDADFWISQEGGLFEEGERLYNRAWIAVCDKSGYIASSSTALFYLPPKITALIKGGMELCDATDEFFQSINSKHGIGAIGYLTDSMIDREQYYIQAALIALSELKHKDWYTPSQ